VGGSAAALVEADHLENPPATLRERYLYIVSGADRLGRLGRLVVELDLAAIARISGETARLEHARRPQPLVNPQRIHGVTVS